MENILEIKHMKKSYPGFQIKDLSLQIPKGVIMGFIGENGAGKTTTIKAILDMIHIDGGEIFVFGKDVSKKGKEIRQEIGVVLSESTFPETLTPIQIEKVLSSMYATWDSAYFHQLLQRFQLPKDKRIKQYSKGMHMKLNITMALAHHPKLLILDEATSGLDPIIRDEILDVFMDFIQDEDHSIFLSSHITSDIEKVADYVTFIHKGEIILSEQKDELMESYGILKTTPEIFAKLKEDEYIAYRKSAYTLDVLVKNKDAIVSKLPEAIIDLASLEDIMLFTVKGERL